jgi:phage terminase Nu1 subunit (DNA packaging protein)
MPDLIDLEVTDADLGALIGLSARHIRRMNLPKVGRNAYRLGNAIKALLEALPGSNAGAELTKERVRKTRAEATRAELELAIAKGEVAPIAEFERAQSIIMAAIQVNIMNVPARAVLQLLGETDETAFKQVLRAELRLALEQSARTEIDLEAESDEEDDLGE